VRKMPNKKSERVHFQDLVMKGGIGGKRTQSEEDWAPLNLSCPRISLKKVKRRKRVKKSAVKKLGSSGKKLNRRTHLYPRTSGLVRGRGPNSSPSESGGGKIGLGAYCRKGKLHLSIHCDLKCVRPHTRGNH